MIATPRPILIDTDLGLCNDDCLALFLALAAPALRLEGISICAGNFSMKQSLYNALSILEYLGRADIPVHPGEDLPLVHRYGEQERRSWGSWGEVGQAIWPFTTPARQPHRPERAHRWLARRLARPGPPQTLLAIGPLTNVSLALHRSPAALPGLREIVIMGGAVEWLPDGAGNATAAAEFNFWVDPEAAREVLRSRLPIRLIPLNIWRRVWLDLDGFCAAAQLPTPAGELLATVLHSYYTEVPDYAVSLGDAMAVMSVLWPELCRYEPLELDVVTEPGPGYGKLQARRPTAQGSTVLVMVEADVDELVRRYLAALVAEASHLKEEIQCSHTPSPPL